MLQTKIVSSLDKCFLDNKIDDFNSINKITALKNERISFQFICEMRDDDDPSRHFYAITMEGELAKYATVRDVRNVPVTLPTFPRMYDDNYLRTTPGLYPDILMPSPYGDKFFILQDQLKTFWVEIDLREVSDEISAGESTFTIFFGGESRIGEAKITIEILDALLPSQTMKLTQWFHCDGLAQHYHCDVWSERHWEIVENFAKTAVSNGINMLLTPLFTPSLDTYEGGERLTTQLVNVTKTDDNGYTFDFTLLDRWIDMCDRAGIKYFEISHFFTQWGAKHAPKVMATVNGEYKKIFGWETDATAPVYTEFLRTFIAAFLAHMKQRGDDKRCHFHISDEPSEEFLPSYQAAKDSIADLLEDYIIMDALSSYEFYKQGVVKTPIPSNDHIKPFIENKVPDLWTYYCCGQWKNVSNRFISMPSYRNRSIGMQMYKYDIVGFLQWGYNYYNTWLSYNKLDPMGDVNGFDWVPAGDTCSVYPGIDGNALESIRIVVFHQALQDNSAMKLAESFVGKEKVVEAIENAFGTAVEFDVCARSTEQMQAVRDAVNDLIKQNICK